MRKTEIAVQPAEQLKTNKLAARLRNENGETLVETLASVMIITMLLTMLAGAILTAARVNSQADTGSTELAVSESTEKGAVTLKIGGGANISINGVEKNGATYPIKLYETNGYYYYEVGKQAIGH